MMKMVRTHKASVHMLFIIIIIMLFNIFPPCQSYPELEILHSIKTSFNDPLKSLSNWNSSLHFCQWNGVSCHNSSSSHVVKIELSGKNLSGKISDKIFQLSYLEYIDLSNNQLFGEIPAGNFSSCLSLKYLNLSNNNFTGPLPPCVSNSKLETFDLSNNMISGKIPENIGLLSELKILDFGGNVLEGRIPSSITNITNLEFLTLASNQLTGEIPRGLGQMKKLRWIYLGYNNLSGEIPKEIGELTCLYHLDLVYNNLTGEIPFSFGNLTNLQFLFLYLNSLTGPIPKSIFNLKKLISLDLSGNFFSGEIPDELMSQLRNLEVLHLFSNNFTGKIPSSLSYFPRLQYLQLWSNRFHGEIPKDLGRYNNLTVVDLSSNFLTGKIPQGICESGRLIKLIMFSNSIEGEIPERLGTHCKSLQRIRLQNNNLSGKLSLDFTQLPRVYFLDLSGNNLVGEIGKWKWNMQALQMLNLARNKFSGQLPDSFGSKKLENLDLSGNDFSGVIPSSIGEFSELVELKLNDNKLSGKIPNEISLCKKLVTLALSHNQLNGEIPPSLSDLPVLGQLDLSQNQFSGEIPRKLGAVGSLVQVNVSYNHLHGRLPSTGAFLVINSSAVAGNIDLCGGDENTGLPPCKSGRRPPWWFFLTCLVSFLFTFALAGFIIIIVMKRRKEPDLIKSTMNNIEDGMTSSWELQFLNSKASKSISIKDILSSPKEENLINRGRTGTSYKGTSTISNFQFVAKVLTDDVNSFSTNLERIHDHPNIVKLIATCKGSGKGRILVYEYIQGKDLKEGIRGLNWDGRLKVGIGVAKAIRHLHWYCSPSSVVVGDLSLHKVIVDDIKGEARLRFSLSKLQPVLGDKKCFISSAYTAPETRESKVVTDKSDIYSLGIMLIELLTGRNPTDSEIFGILHENIVEWARYCYSDCHLDTWVDQIIRIDALQNQNQIVETMNLALQCTASDPNARPSAIDVVKRLELVATGSSRTTTCALVSKCFFN